jgi:hypothetical protein
MKKKCFTTLCFLGIFSLFLIFSNCGKGDNKAGMDAAKQLLETLNKTPMGMGMQVDPANISAEASDSRFLITFKNPSITFDTSAFKSFGFGEQFKDVKIPISFEELTYLYGPGEKYLEFVSARGFKISFDMGKMIKFPEGKEEEAESLSMMLNMEMGKMTFKGYNVSAVLAYQGKDLLELAGMIINDNKNIESSTENFKYQFDFVTKEKENMSVLVEAEKIEASQKNVSSMFLSLYKKDAETPDFARALQEGTPIIDLSAGCSNLKITVKKDGNELGGGTLGGMNLTYFLKPNEAKTFFNYGSTWSLKNLSLNIPEKKEIELFGKIDEMNMNFSLENISADFGKAYFNFVKNSMAIVQGEDKDKLKEEQAGMAMGLMGELMKSQPVIKFSITPLKHHYGEMTASADFRMPTMMTPAGKAEVKILKINDILAKLKADQMISPEVLTEIEGTIKKFFIVDANGDGSLTFEIKADQPGKYFLNGNEMGK